VNNFLFVYGTLRSEFQNPHGERLRSEAELIGPATVNGTIFRVSHYPGFRPTPEGAVKGELYRLGDPVALLHALDAYEGSEYIRIQVPVRTGIAETDALAWIYQYKYQPAPDTQIQSGDFCKP
jgi:gamma-glutamylcyclotransferase (GGCT)/AIG2-like uncharacterized protein YtfP